MDGGSRKAPHRRRGFPARHPLAGQGHPARLAGKHDRSPGGSLRIARHGFHHDELHLRRQGGYHLFAPRELRHDDRERGVRHDAAKSVRDVLGQLSGNATRRPQGQCRTPRGSREGLRRPVNRTVERLMSTTRYPSFKAAACHTAPIFLDSARTIDKATSLIEEAAGNGASLIAFPESFVPGFPIWAALRAPILNHDFFLALAGEAIRLDGPEIGRIRAAARRHGVHVSLGFTEGTDASVGCLWNSNVLIGPDGAVLNLHRKLVPTFFEKLIWANGDARGLRVVQTKLGRIGMLICGENTNPLSRFALMAEGEQVHISPYPPCWPTRPPAESGGYDLRRAIEIRAGAHAFEAKVFNIVSSAFTDQSLKDRVGLADKAILDVIERSPQSVSMILDPTGG